MSLSDVVKAMSTETNNSTLGWDVVVNYSAKDMNALLAAAYEQGGEGQLKDMNFKTQGYDKYGNPYDVNYDFELGAPSIQFTSKGDDPTCSVTIPITGGSVKTPAVTMAISPDVYSIFVAEIPLASATGTVGAPRDPQDSDKPFTFSSPNTTGVVTLNLGVAGASIVVSILTANVDKSKHVGWIDNQKGDLSAQIETYLKDPHTGGSIRWDLASANNHLPSQANDAATSLVPKLFYFTIYATDANSDSILSLFIQTDATKYGEEKAIFSLWTAQWTKYGVPPIPSSYTASVIFNNGTIAGLMDQSAEAQGCAVKASPTQPKSGLELTVQTHKSYNISGENVIKAYYHVSRSGVQLNFDDESSALHITIDQSDNPDSGPSVQMNWSFSFPIHWTEWIYPKTNNEGDVTISNQLKTASASKSIDDSELPSYVVSLDASIAASDWDTPVYTSPDLSGWQKIAGETDWKPDFVVDNLPALPTVNLKLIDFNFFMTTNLLLPGSKVITFDKDPGVRFPRDLYVVGQVNVKS